jgi:hypothetical protein
MFEDYTAESELDIQFSKLLFFLLLHFSNYGYPFSHPSLEIKI